MSYSENLKNAITKVGDDINNLRGRTGVLVNLSTTDKTNLVAAINELKTLLDGIELTDIINDTLANATDKTYSIDKIKATINASINQILDGAPAALDTLSELAAALQSNDSELAAITTALNDRVAYTAQTKTAAQKTQARANIDAMGKDDLGSLTIDFLTEYNNHVTNP